MSVIEVNQANYRSTVVESDKPVLVDFWADWCAPCMKLRPVIEEIAEEFAGKAIVASVDVSQERTLSALLQIMHLPTLVFFHGGKPVAQLTGSRPKADIVATLEKFL